MKNLSIKKSVMSVCSVILMGSSVCAYADYDYGSSVHLHACVYSTTNPTEPMQYTFTHKSEYCMLSPANQQSQTLTITVDHEGLNCSDGYINGAYKWWSGGGDLCYTYASYSDFTFASKIRSGSGMLYWGGDTNKGLYSDQFYMDADPVMFQLCKGPGLCSSKPNETLYYYKGQDLYLIYTPFGK